MLNNYKALSFGPGWGFPPTLHIDQEAEVPTMQHRSRGKKGWSGGLGTETRAEGPHGRRAVAAVCLLDQALTAKSRTGLDLLCTESAPDLENGHRKVYWESHSSNSRGQL